jgi:polar amino acid transport system permease protein
MLPLERMTPSRPPHRPASVVPLRHPYRQIATLIVLCLIAMSGYSAATNARFQWEVALGYVFADPILEGLLCTLALTAVVMIIGVVFGTIIAIMRLSSSPVMSGAAWLFTWFFRGIPPLVQLIFWYNFSALYPQIRVGVPFLSPLLVVDANQVISPLAAAVLGLGLVETAYASEIVRSGILSVDEGQSEAAAALGMRPALIMRAIVLPQAMRVIIPPLGSQAISLLKTTSIVSVIAVGELFHAAQTIYARTFETIPLLITASLWYLFLTTVLSIGQGYLEKHFGRGSPRRPRPGLAQQLGWSRPTRQAS